MKGKIHILILMLILLLALTGCRHKDLVFDHASTARVRVIFDWSNAKDAHPSSMVLYLYEKGGGEPLRYVFDNRDGGYIYLPFGTYESICLNGDITGWASERNKYDTDTFEVFTPDMRGHNTNGPLPAEYLEHLLGSDVGERVILPPEALYTARGETFTLTVADTDKVIVLRPVEATCHYTIDIVDMDNLEALSDSPINATLSQMSESYFAGRYKAGHNAVAVPCIFHADREHNSLHAEFINFGLIPDERHKNTLRLSFLVSDSSIRSFEFDVTDQAKSAPDPHHVYIRLKGFTVPHTLSGSGGIRPDVNGWESVIIPIPMP